MTGRASGLKKSTRFHQSNMFVINKKRENNNHASRKSKTNYDDDDELLRKLNIYTDNDDYLTPSMSLTTIASALPDTDYIDSTGDKVNTKSSSYCDMEGAASFDDVDYSEYDFDDDDEEPTHNPKFNFNIFHGSINNLPIVEKKKYKNGTRSSLTFSNQRVKEIERDNRILLEKIMRNGPSNGDSFSKQYSNINNQRPKVKSAAEINRRKKQQQIHYENQILKRKLEKIATRRASVSNSLG